MFILYHALNFQKCREDTKTLIKGDSMDFREILKLQFDVISYFGAVRENHTILEHSRAPLPPCDRSLSTGGNY